MDDSTIKPQSEDFVVRMGKQFRRCTARMKSTGERCTHPAVSGYSVCRMHGANPKNHGGGQPGNLNPLKHGAYVKKMLTDEEKAIFEDILAAIHRDFELNESTDLAQAAMAAFYYAKWHCAVLGNANAAIGEFDVLFRKQLECLKTTRAQRDTGGGQQTTPAEWAVALLESVRGGATGKAKKETPED